MKGQRVTELLQLLSSGKDARRGDSVVGLSRWQSSPVGLVWPHGPHLDQTVRHLSWGS